VLTSLLAGRDRESVLKSDGLLEDLKKALAERTQHAGMDVYLDSESERDGGN
jgi:putative transposase